MLLLRGPMGAGKTTFTRALARGMKVDAPEQVCSPTYTVCMTHPGRVPLVHLDLFRFGELGQGGPVSGGAFESLGLAYDELPPAGAVLVVEWSELWSDPPEDALTLELSAPSDEPGSRVLEVRATGPRSEALLGRWGDALAAENRAEVPGEPR